MCEKCENPETVLKVLPKRGIINSSCKACGHNFVVDMRHKLSTFILRNPPEQDLDKAGTSLTKKQVHVCVKQYLGHKNELRRLPSWNFQEQHTAGYIIIKKWTPFLLRDEKFLKSHPADTFVVSNNIPSFLSKCPINLHHSTWKHTTNSIYEKPFFYFNIFYSYQVMAARNIFD